MEDVVKFSTRNLSGSLGPVGTDSEALQECLLKFGEDRKRLLNSVGTFADWIANGRLTWVAYSAFISGRLFMLDTQPIVCTVGVLETWRRLFDKCVLRVTGPEDTSACQDDNICARIKAGISDAVHGVQYIWDTKLTTEY